MEDDRSVGVNKSTYLEAKKKLAPKEWPWYVDIVWWGFIGYMIFEDLILAVGLGIALGSGQACYKSKKKGRGNKCLKD